MKFFSFNYSDFFFHSEYTQIMNKQTAIQAFRVSVPVLFGYITLGIAFGLVVINSGYPWWIAFLTSVFMYSGAGQFVAIGLFAANTPLISIIIAVALVSIRHIIYGLSLITKYKNTGKWKIYLIFALTDETYSILTTLDVPKNSKTGEFYGLISLFNQFYWVLGTVLGALIGKILPFDLTGVDFALTALFAVLTVEQFLKSKDFIPILIGSLTTICSIILCKFEIISSSNILLVSLCSGIAILFLVKSHKNLKNYENGEKTEKIGDNQNDKS